MVVLLTRRRTHATTAAGQAHTAALATQTSLPALLSDSHGKLDHEMVPLSPSQQDSPSSWVLGARSPETGPQFAGTRRRTSLDQHLLGLLLPKPTYSTRPQYCGRKMVFVAAKEPNTYQVSQEQGATGTTAVSYQLFGVQGVRNSGFVSFFAARSAALQI